MFQRIRSSGIAKCNSWRVSLANSQGKLHSRKDGEALGDLSSSVPIIHAT